MTVKNPKPVKDDFDPASLVPEGFERDEDGNLRAVDPHPTTDD